MRLCNRLNLYNHYSRLDVVLFSKNDKFKVVSLLTSKYLFFLKIIDWWQTFHIFLLLSLKVEFFFFLRTFVKICWCHQDRNYCRWNNYGHIDIFDSIFWPQQKSVSVCFWRVNVDLNIDSVLICQNLDEAPLAL